jgi:outer membrane lipoprotein-sorting protein
MTNFSRATLFALCCVLVAGSAAAPRGQAQMTADEVIEKHLAASGGRDALTKITSRRATGTVAIQTPGGELSGPAEVLSKAPNKARVYITLDLTSLGVNDKMIVEQKFDGVAGWSQNSMQGDTQITGSQLENMKNNTFPTPLLTYKTTGMKAELLPREQVGGKSMIVLLMTPKSGAPVRMYLDPDTYLVARTKATLNTPEMGDLEQIGDVSDYRTVDGVKIPFHIVNSNAAQNVTIKFEKVEHNVAIDDAVFSVKK